MRYSKNSQSLEFGYARIIGFNKNSTVDRDRRILFHRIRERSRFGVTRGRSFVRAPKRFDAARHFNLSQSQRHDRSSVPANGVT